MTFTEALVALKAGGLFGAPAIVSLQSALKVEGTDSIDELVKRALPLSRDAVVERYGHEAARSVLILVGCEAVEQDRSVADLTEQEIEQFTDVMLRKTLLVYGLSIAEQRFRGHLRDVIRQVVIDTELLASGAVPLHRWLESDAEVTAS